MKQSHAPGSQRTKSMKSCYRSIPGARDRGQRYVVTYRDGLGERHEFGFTDDVREARAWIGKIAANPTWRNPYLTDRQAEKGAQ